jgi:hypothetical protein
MLMMPLHILLNMTVVGKWGLGNARQRIVSTKFQNSPREEWNLPGRNLVLD